MFKLAKYLLPYSAPLALTLLLLLGQALAELFLPTLMADIVNNGVVYSVLNQTSRTYYIIQVGGLMLIIAFTAGLASIGSTYIAQRISAGAARNLRRDLFAKVESFSQSEFDKFSSASLITRCTNDVGQVQNLVNISARMLVYAPILGIGGVIMAMTRSVRMSWIIALAVVVLVCLVILITSIVMPKFKILQEMVDKLNKISREILHGLMVIRAFSTQKHEKKRFDGINADLRDMNLFVQRVMAIVGPLITFIMAGTQLLVIWVGAYNIAHMGLPIGDMMAFMQYAVQVIFSFMMVSMVLVMVPRAQVSATRIAEVLDTKLTINDPSTPESFTAHAEKTANSHKGIVAFENVHFRYPAAEEDVLEGISFTAKPGQTTAIIGPTGSGKSTLAALLLRFYDVSQGSITIDGLDIRNVRQTDLRDKIGFVPQKGQLLTGTIASNIRYGNLEATDEEIQTIAAVAQATDFIQERDDKYEAEIAQGGGNVSGGQRQRLSIARALAKNPEIIVFDDSFSALDFATDAKLRRALKEHTANATVIVIAQRIGTIMHAEQIIVLDKGKIAGRGTHEELLKSCPAYHEIASSQDALNESGVAS
ncbi:MAG: ABC transporter ATP-binding protein/permease [Defluviitaleaceae bacterium]|nr:ABC transporter ATP-binding protein/permease [Defluviitaleaceae bacterium]MCL2273748.1 ABC transporter ATP-binding protein/permease [Defluviitaleaceae bacterium]